jgi:hypothetical protein
MALSRIDRESSENLAEVFADAILFGQCVESRMLGVALPDPAKFPPGVQTTLARAVGNVDLWMPIVRSLVALLLRDDRVTGAQMTAVADCGNTSGGLATGEPGGRQRLEDYELKPASLRERRREQKRQAALN